MFNTLCTFYIPGFNIQGVLLQSILGWYRNLVGRCTGLHNQWKIYYIHRLKKHLEYNICIYIYIICTCMEYAPAWNPLSALRSKILIYNIVNSLIHKHIFIDIRCTSYRIDSFVFSLRRKEKVMYLLFERKAASVLSDFEWERIPDE